MQVTATTGVTAETTRATTVTSDAGNATLDYNAFLHLLVAQLKNQDPTKPIDSTQYMAQLASFSNVEQSIKLNSKLDTLIVSGALSQVDDIMGRRLTSADGSLSGIVTGVTIVEGGATAVLDTGAELSLGPGVRITEP